MTSTVTLLQPAPVTRDNYGHWYHPDLPTFAGSDEATEDSPKWSDWLKEQGLQVSSTDLEDEDENHPAYVRYFDEGDGNISDWEPKQPEGEGWFTLGIFDTEDGPTAWFVRRVA